MLYKKILAQAKKLSSKMEKKMNLLNKTAPWLVASVLAATSLFAEQDKSMKKCQPCSTPCDFKEMMPGMPGYNAPSRVNVCGNWDLYFTGSFIYWQVAQDNMEFALNDTNSLAEITTPGVQGSYVEMDFAFKPGFKVGVGMNFDYDNWDSFAEYTRLHGTNSNSATNPTGGLLFANRGNLHLDAKSQVFDSASSSFKTNLDFVDWVVGRNYFVGKSLMFHPVLGARGGWITQSCSTHYKNSTLGSSGGTTVDGVIARFSSIDVYSRVRSWEVGPRTGLESCWMLGQGIRLFGNGYADIVYAKYKLQEKTSYTINSTGVNQPVATKERVSAVRTHLDLEVGFGWGSYFDNNNWHIDLSAAYGFQVFFNQNMFRNFTDNVVVAAGSVAQGDMTIQGLTATVRLDF
jgi:hypothetical protein